jgi:hypothetical protein
MASKRKASTAVTRGNATLINTAIRVLLDVGNQPLTPAEIAEIGKAKNLLRVPRGRTRGYLGQLLQSSLYNNSAYSVRPVVVRTGRGKYKAAKNFVG